MTPTSRAANRAAGIRAARYRKLPIGEKQAENLAKMREPAVVCPICDAHTTARDLLEHLASRCPGRREPHPGSAWVTWREALALGVPATTLSFWARTEQVRFIGARQDRKYLMRDLAKKIAQRRMSRRR